MNRSSGEEASNHFGNPKVLLVGLGKVGLTYDLGSQGNQVLTHTRGINNWSNVTGTDVDLHGVDTDPGTKKIFLKTSPSASWSESYVGLSEYEFNLAIVATPIPYLVNTVEEILAHTTVKRFVVEKPGADSLTTLLQLQNLLNLEGRAIVGFPRPSLPSTRYLKDIVSKFPNESWEVEIHFSGSVLNILSHFLNFTKHLFGDFSLLEFHFNRLNLLEAIFSSADGKLSIKTFQYGDKNDERNRIEVFGPISISYTESGRRIEIRGKSKKDRISYITMDSNGEIQQMLGYFAFDYMQWSLNSCEENFTKINSSTLYETIRLAEEINK
jgi:predicted dehydrogenase